MNNSNKQMVWVNQIIQINNKWTKQTKQIYNVQRKYIFLIFSNLFWSRVLDDLSLNRKDHLVPNFIFDSKIVQLQTTKAFYFINKIEKSSLFYCCLGSKDCKKDCKNIVFFSILLMKKKALVIWSCAIFLMSLDDLHYIYI